MNIKNRNQVTMDTGTIPVPDMTCMNEPGPFYGARMTITLKI